MQNQQIVNRVSKLEEEIKEIKRILNLIPYGSDIWWQKEILAGEKEIAEKRFKRYHKASDLIADLHKGK